jgi:CBS domain-containing protein
MSQPVNRAISGVTVADLMSSDVITVTEDDSIARADVAMRYAHIRHVPVINDQREVVGILSDRDILGWMAHCHDTQLSVAHTMTREVELVRADAPAEHALAVLLRERFSCLPVVDDDERLVGIITETDFLSFAEQVLRGRPDIERPVTPPAALVAAMTEGIMPRR